MEGGGAYADTNASLPAAGSSPWMVSGASPSLCSSTLQARRQISIILTVCFLFHPCIMRASFMKVECWCIRYRFSTQSFHGAAAVSTCVDSLRIRENTHISQSNIGIDCDNHHPCILRASFMYGYLQSF
eukprot:COSAG01_NODE_20110_length_970_cov_0.901263_2_plen_129_part_00